MRNKLKPFLITFIGLIVWTFLMYIGIAFLKAELNAFLWPEHHRAVLLFMVFCYLAFSPLIIIFADL